MRNSLRFNFDVLAYRLLRAPERAAATDQTWSEWRYAKALHHEQVLRKERGLSEKIDVWDGSHSHLAALFVAEKRPRR